MKYTLAFHPEALKEYKAASSWYETQQHGLAFQFQEAIERKIEQIINNPDTFSFVKGPYRQAKVETFPFVIVYRLGARKHQIYVSSIFHTSRNPRGKYRKV